MNSNADKVFTDCGQFPNRSGRRMYYLDRLKRRFTDQRDDRPEYECRGCGAGFDGRRQVCSECGGYSVRRREWDPALFR